jgi:hypothetical protein
MTRGRVAFAAAVLGECLLLELVVRLEVKGEVIWENYTTAGHILQLIDRLIVKVIRAGMQPPKGDYDTHRSATCAAATSPNAPSTVLGRAVRSARPTRCVLIGKLYERNSECLLVSFCTCDRELECHG